MLARKYAYNPLHGVDNNELFNIVRTLENVAGVDLVALEDLQEDELESYIDFLHDYIEYVYEEGYAQC